MKQFHSEDVDQADLGAEKQNPGNSAQDPRDDKRNDGHDPKNPF